jgi:hypothetical protein
MGSLNTALAAKYTKDRFGVMLFQEDGIFSAFSYLDFFPDIAGDPDPKRRADRLNALWRQDIAQSLPPLDAQPNISYHIPFYRNFNEAHCLTIVDFSGTGIEEAGIADLTPFIDKNLERKAVLRTVEQDQVSDLSRPVSLAMTILAIVLEFFS